TCRQAGGSTGEDEPRLSARRWAIYDPATVERIKRSPPMECSQDAYELAVARHHWEVPDHYNIALDVCDRHPRDKLAMIHEHFSGAVREVRWGELQDLSNRFANLLAEHGVARGDRVAVVLPPTPETAAVFFATWKLGAL